MSLSKIRENARTALKGKWGKAVLIILAYLAFDFALTIICGIFGIDILTEIVTLIIDVPVMLGFIYAFMKLIRNEEIHAFDFLHLGFSNFVRSWKINLTTLLKVILPVILLIISMVLMSLSIGSSFESIEAGAIGEVNIGMFILGIIIMIVALIWLFVKSLFYSLTIYIAYDNPEMTASEIVNESARLMEGNRAKIFLLDLSFIGWTILATFTFGIGYLWLIPYMQVAVICFYEYLIGKSSNADAELS